MDQDIDLKTLKTTELDLSEGLYLDIPKNIVFPNELNQYLKEQLQLHLHENALLQNKLIDLKEQLHESRTKNEGLRTKIREYEILSGKNEFISSTAVATNKIVELSKKVRDKTSELEVYKTKCSKLEHRVFELKEEIHNIQQPDEPEKTPNSDLEEQVKHLQEKLTGMKNKLLETKNQNAQLKNDLKYANKWLQQETGENFDSLNNIHSTNSNWRGRAQIICDLQKKNSDLREKLKNIQQSGTSSSMIIAETKPDKKNDALTKDNTELRKQLEELKRKFDGTRARAKYLDAECVALRNKISTLNTDIDDRRQEMSGLKAQLNIEKRFKNESQKQREELVTKFEEEKEKLKVELGKKDSAMKNLMKQLDEQGEEMNTLRNKVRGSRPPSSYGKKPNIQVPNEDKATISRLEVERQKLLELTDLQNKRLEAERNQHQKTEMELRLERQRAAKLEANVARLELEFSSKSSTYSTNTTHRENDYEMLKNQLELAKENIETLQTRLDVEKHERKVDLHQFASILQNYTNSKDNVSES